ncbi:hypothetical protein Pan258_06770 [Symmachiella dynata]|nr:hypothetical protein Pan258_06770 [Symmachiella dynata]
MPDVVLATANKSAYNSAIVNPCFLYTAEFETMSEPPPRNNIFFPLTIVAGTLFAITILAVTMATLSDSRAPVAKFLNAYAGILIGVEVGSILTLGFLAMTVDRLRTLRENRLTITNPPEAETSTKGPEL